MATLKTRAFVFVFALLFFGLSGFADTANAETSSRVRKKTTTITTIERESDIDDVDDTSADSGIPERESIITARFGGVPVGVSGGQTGTAGCKTAALAKNVIKDLKADCQAWVKDQKTELKKRYLTSSCEEACEDCGMSLKRCSVNGTVKYLLK